MSDEINYLREIYKDNLPYPYSEKDYKGFDKRETYNYDGFFIDHLYQSLRYFQDVAYKVVDFDYQSVKINGEDKTISECISLMIDDCKVLMTKDWMKNENVSLLETTKDHLFLVLSKCFFYLWW